MLTHELSLLLISIAALVGTPLYIFNRNKMVKEETKGDGGFSHGRVVALTLINISLISVAYLFFQLMFISVLHFQFPTTSISIVLSLMFLLVTGFTYYGSGIYITSIVLEAFTLPHLRKITAFKTQFIATHLFHGPISHFLIYSGFIFALFVLALLEHFSPFTLKINLVVAILSLPVGIIYAVAQIYNKTYKYQLVVSLFCLMAYLLVLASSLLVVGTLGAYFLGFSTSLSLALLGYFFHRKAKRRTLFQ